MTNRRRDEKALFEKAGGEGTALEIAEESPQNKVTWLEGYRESTNDKTIIVAHKGADVVEILTLESPEKEDYYQRFVNWLRETDPRDFYVDWGLGTCPTP